MSVKSAIEWTDATWSPLRVRVRLDAAAIAKKKGYTSLIQLGEKMAGRVGQHCEHVSSGCKLCYSGTWQARCLKVNGTGLPFDRRSRDLVEPFVDEKVLVQPLRWKARRRIFVANQSDLFGEWYTDEMIDRVFAVMALCPQHTFQVLTKRQGRMLRYLGESCPSGTVGYRISVSASNIGRTLPKWQEHSWIDPAFKWPLTNVWLGVSVEDQATADERIPLLLQTPAAKRFVSYEPALGPVDFSNWLTGKEECIYVAGKPQRGLDQIIVGGESGPGARPFDVQWARNTIAQCKDAGVACFVKQLGAKPVSGGISGPGEHWPNPKWAGDQCLLPDGSYGWKVRLKDPKGGDMSEWPEDLRVRQFPAVVEAHA